jgi:putative ABC transport system permease protein
MADLWADFRRAVRNLAASRGFTLVALLTLGLGIGVSTAAFTIVNAVLLKPPPYRDAHRLVSIADVSHGEASGVGMSNYLDWRRDNTVFEDLALTESASDIFGGQAGEEAERVQGADVTSSFFHVLGVAPVLGRAFTAGDEFKGRTVDVIVLSDGLWRRRYGARPDIVGRTVAFNGRPCTVVGVMPPGFWHLESGTAEYWVPQRWTGAGRSQHQYSALARLKPGVTLDAAQAQMSAIAKRIELEYPEARGWGVAVTPLGAEITAQVREPLAVLAAAVGLVLLVACGNLASLLLVRSASRARDTAVRSALGAGRWRILREVLIEVGVLAAGGAALGGLASTWLVHLVARAVPAQYQLPMALEPDGRVLAFALLASAVAALASSALPALRASRVDLVASLKASGAASRVSRGHHRILRAAIVAELAFAAILLAAGGLLVSSLLHLLQADLGFDTRNLLTMQVRPLGGESEARNPTVFYEDLLTRVSSIAGVRSASATWGMPMSSQYSGGGFSIEGRPVPPEWQRMSAQNCVVTPGYFETMGMRLHRGRGFDEHDREGAPPVVIINQALAERHWNGQDPVGVRIRRGDDWSTIVGVVSDVRYSGPTGIVPPAIYRPLAQAPASTLFLVVRMDGERAAIVARIRQQLQALDRSAVVIRVQTMEELLVQRTGGARLIAATMAGFAVLALALAAVGLYGAMAQWVGQRRQEIGVRLALGASRRQVVELVFREGILLSAIGAGLGLAGAAAVTRAMSSLLYGVGPTDPVIFTCVPLALVAAALVACYAPARRSASVDPIDALRCE